MNELDWNQRFSIIDYFNPSDNQICEVFGVSQRELNIARDLRSRGCFKYKSQIDVDDYKKWFCKEELPTSTPTSTPAPKAKTRAAPKAKKYTEKPGRKTHKIKDAYENVPREPVPVEEFRAKYNVSLSVLRRHKDFDHIPETGKVRVMKKTIKNAAGNDESMLCIFREEPT